jgi:hypothetical protein
MSTHQDLWELTQSESAAMRRLWEKFRAPWKKIRKKVKATLTISTAHNSRLALMYVVSVIVLFLLFLTITPSSDEQEESEDESFINDSPIPTPEPSDDEHNTLESL